MAYITYQPGTNTVKQTFQKGQGTTVSENDCSTTLNAFTII
jgi:hypothetical protein